MQQCKFFSKSSRKLETTWFYNLTLYNIYHKACITQQLSNTSQLIISASETTSPVLLILFLKKLVGETCNKNWFSQNSYSLPACYTTWVKHLCSSTLNWSWTPLSNYSNKNRRLGLFPSTQVTSPNSLSTQKHTNAKQCWSRKGKCFSTSCHQTSNAGQNPKQPPPAKCLWRFTLRPLPSLPVTIPIPASQLPHAQL